MDIKSWKVIIVVEENEQFVEKNVTVDFASDEFVNLVMERKLDQIKEKTKEGK